MGDDDSVDPVSSCCLKHSVRVNAAGCRAPEAGDRGWSYSSDMQACGLSSICIHLRGVIGSCCFLFAFSVGKQGLHTFCENRLAFLSAIITSSLPVSQTHTVCRWVSTLMLCFSTSDLTYVSKVYISVPFLYSL